MYKKVQAVVEGEVQEVDYFAAMTEETLSKL